MKRKIKRCICFAITAIMIMSVAAGCGNDNDTVSDFVNRNEDETLSDIPTTEGNATESADDEESGEELSIEQQSEETPSETEDERSEEWISSRLENAQSKLDRVVDCYYYTLDGGNVNAYFMQRMGYSYTEFEYNQQLDYAHINAFFKDGNYISRWEAVLPLVCLYYDKYVNDEDKYFSYIDLIEETDSEDDLIRSMSNYQYEMELPLMEGVVGFAPMFAKHEISLHDPEEAVLKFGTEENGVISEYRVGFDVDGTDYGYSMYFSNNGKLLGIKNEMTDRFLYSYDEEVFKRMSDDGVWEVYEWTIENSSNVPDFIE